MYEPTTAPWGLSISTSDFNKVNAGFKPRDQNDKWRVTVKHDTQSGTISVHLARSGTGIELYVLLLKPSDGGSGSSSDTKIEAITWEQNKGGIRISEQQAKKEVVSITRSLLECDFEAFPEYDPDDVWNHPAARIGAN